MAASLLIFLAFASYTDMFSSRNSTLKFSTNMGSRATVTLPDGSSVVLNAGSNLEYLYNTSNRVREVIFSGEGLFEVSKSKIPFVIHTSNGLSLKVLGTKFNLKAYSGDTFARTTLLDGKVELVSPKNQVLSLEPGQIASYNDMTKNLEYTSGLAYQDFGWVENKLYMDNMSLEDVCKILERWYDVRISMEHKLVVDKIHYTGVLKEGTILDVLNALCELSEIKYQIEGKNIIIYNFHKPMIK
jgi:ferric-dicitrate binding protein FerR (iron transport regulator)